MSGKDLSKVTLAPNEADPIRQNSATRQVLQIASTMSAVFPWSSNYASGQDAYNNIGSGTIFVPAGQQSVTLPSSPSGVVWDYLGTQVPMLLSTSSSTSFVANRLLFGFTESNHPANTEAVFGVQLSAAGCGGITSGADMAQQITATKQHWGNNPSNSAAGDLGRLAGGNT